MYFRHRLKMGKGVSCGGRIKSVTSEKEAWLGWLTGLSARSPQPCFPLLTLQFSSFNLARIVGLNRVVISGITEQNSYQVKKSSVGKMDITRTFPFLNFTYQFNRD